MTGKKSPDKETVPPVVLQRFSQNLEELIEKVGVQKQQVYKWIPCASTTFHKWLKGKALPGSWRLFRLAKFLGVSADALFEGTRDELYKDPEGAKRPSRD